MTRAETALAEAKRAGRDCFVPYRISDEQRQRHRIGMALGERVQRALRDGRLCFAYQPVVDANTGAVDYYECLLRMIDEDGRIIAAGEFVAAIEQLGFIRLIDRYVLERAVAEAAAHPGICLGFNISGLTATDRAWLRGASAILQDKREVASRLVVEITETAALHDIEESAALRRHAARASAAASRSTISAPASPRCAISRRSRSIPSRSTARSCAISPRSPTTRCSCAISSAWPAGLNLLTVAECVETAEEAAMLRREGVHFLQGYYFGVPTLEPPWAVSIGRRSARPPARTSAERSALFLLVAELARPAAAAC